MAKLLIVESPGKLKTLRAILGAGWDVQPSVGHITELAHDGDDALGFDMGDQTINCRYIARGDRGRDVIQKLKSSAQKAQEVYLATDPDREGEAIAWHIAQQLKLKNPYRVVYTQITEQAVKKALEKPTRLNISLVDAQRCRQCLDKLVGYKVSPLLWQSTGGKSAGRVQSATLHLLCQRERDIQAFVPQDYWSVFVDYAEGFRAFFKGQPATEGKPKKGKATDSKLPADQQQLGFLAADGVESVGNPEDLSALLSGLSAVGNDADDTADEAPDDAKDEAQSLESARVLSEALAEKILDIARNNPHQILSAVGKLTTKAPPPPFITSSLQQAAGSQIGFNPEKTMQVAQSLYEGVTLPEGGSKGLITYMRTDSVTLSPEFIADVESYLSQKDPKNLPKKKTRHRSKDSAQAAHEAIRPTDVFLTPKKLQGALSADQYALYSLIWRRAVASQAAHAQLRKTTLVTQSGPIVWEARGMMVEFAGYTFYWNNLEKTLDLPSLEKGLEVHLELAGHEQKQTQPPSRYTEAKLVQLMEKKGIGRPSTYASTIKTLKERSYVDLKGKILHPTALGLETDGMLSDVLPDLVSSTFTADMESKLDDIAEGRQAWEPYLIGWNRQYLQPELEKAMRLIRERFPKRLFRGTSNNENLAKSRTKCPHCEKPLSKIPSKKVSKGYFLKCTDTTAQTPECEELVLFWSDRDSAWQAPRNQRKPEDEPKGELTEFPCPVCKTPMEIYHYTKEGQAKQLLRCSDAKARQEKKHEKAVYFQSKGKWWSPQFGELS